MSKQFDPTNTSVAEIHNIICDDAVQIANNTLLETPIPNKWKGPVFRNDSPYNASGLSIAIAEEYQGAPERVKRVYQRIGKNAIARAIGNNQDTFVGMIFGEAREGRNYFERWQQAPTRIF